MFNVRATHPFPYLSTNSIPPTDTSTVDRIRTAPLLPTIPPNLTLDPPLIGITHLTASPSASHFASVQATQPTVVHISTLIPRPGASAAVQDVAKVILSAPVRSIRWGGKGGKEGKEKLAVVGKNGAVYTWEKDGWVDEVEEEGMDKAEEEGGVVEGVGIPNGRLIMRPYVRNYSLMEQ